MGNYRLLGLVCILWLFSNGVNAETSGAVAPGIVTGKAVQEVRTAPSGKASIRILNRGEKAFMGILTLDAGAKVPLHRDESEEHIWVMEGGGMLFLGGKKYPLRAGDSVLMPAGLEVRFENGSSRLVVLQVFSGPKSAQKYDSWVERRE